MQQALVFLLLGAFLLPVATVIGVVLIGPRLSPRARERFVRLSSSMWRSAIFGVLVWAFLTTVNVVVGGGSVIRAFIGSAPMALMFVGFGVLGQMATRRGDTRRCAKCEYDLSGVAEEAAAEALCPECGAAWAAPGGEVVGDKGWSPKAVVIAGLLFLPLLASLILPFTLGHNVINIATARLLPTGSLIEQVVSGRGFRMDEWAELRKRTLTPEHRESLARGLLTRDALQLHAWSDESKWFVAEFAAGTLSRETREAVLARFIGARWQTPDQAALQQALGPSGTAIERRPEWTVVGDGAWGLGGCFAGWSGFVVAGEVVDSDGAVAFPASQLEMPLDIATRSQPASKTTWTVHDPLAPSLRVTTEGRPRVTLWLVVEPRVRDAHAVTWRDGAPVTTSDAIVTRVELDASVDSR